MRRVIVLLLLLTSCVSQEGLWYTRTAGGDISKKRLDHDWNVCQEQGRSCLSERGWTVVSGKKPAQGGIGPLATP
jgi:hypothetical protein